MSTNTPASAIARKTVRRVARPVGDVEQGDPRLGLVELDAGDHQVLHAGWCGRGAVGVRVRPAGRASWPRVVDPAGEDGESRPGVRLRRAGTPGGRRGEPATADGAIDQHADLDLAGRDHLDVDAGRGQGLEHRGGDAGVGAHAQADDRDLGDLGVVGDARGADLAWRRPRRRAGSRPGRPWRR